jgi:hypothetical protein
LPDKGKLIGELEVLLARDTIPLAFPVPDGWKLTVMVTNWPGGNVTPAPIPPAEKLEPETEFCCKVSGLSPTFEKVISKDLLLPTATSPKSALELPMVRTGSAGGGVEIPPPVPPAPPQPAVARTAARRAKWSLLILFVIWNFHPALPIAATGRRLLRPKNERR